MTFLKTSELVDSKHLRSRVAATITKVATDVMGEAKGSMTDAQMDKRSALAWNTLLDPVRGTDRFMWAVCVNPTIAAAGIDATDGDLEYVVISVWDDIAGVTTADKTPPATA